MKKFKDTVEVTLKDIIEAKVINKRFTGAHVSITKETGKSARAENEKRRQAQRKKLGLENMQMYEGTWATPDTPKKMGQLKKLLKGKLTAKNAPKLLYNLVGNDDLFDLIGEIRKSEGPNADVRDAVKFWLDAHPEVGFKEEVEVVDERSQWTIKNTKTGQLYSISRYQDDKKLKKIQQGGGDHKHAAHHKDGKPVNELGPIAGLVVRSAAKHVAKKAINKATEKKEGLEAEASSYFKKKNKDKNVRAFGISRKKGNIRHGEGGYREDMDEGVNLRRFGLVFEMMPKSPQETQMAKDVIKYFRSGMIPESIRAGGISAGFRTPARFEIKLKHGNSKLEIKEIQI